MENIYLKRFYEAHRQVYEIALAEIRLGRKQSHWMWFIFPQLKGLGKSSMAQYYAIGSAEEAALFAADPYLGNNLREISNALLDCPGNDPVAILGRIDAMKLKSCMTLFAHTADDPDVFIRVLDRFFGGKPDFMTLRLLEDQQ